MNISMQPYEDGLSLKLVGEMTIYTAQESYQALLSHRESVVGDLYLDLSEVSEMDTAGVQLLLYLDRHMLPNHHIHILQSNPSVDTVLNLYDIKTLLVEPDIEEG